MPRYCLNSNAQSDSGDYEVHQTWPTECIRMPAPDNQLDLGHHINCYSAIHDAKEKYPHLASRIDGCFYCSSECHNH